ncbi:hypothetical protein LCGC14_1591850 [marine sediment metagenome]|uniref:Uncharacterized protein n=1 Tax=marine sediment metagenome TaxID=412755 RepID=A0A0F9IE64_9ZZZZ
MKYKFIEIEIANFCEGFVKAIIDERPTVIQSEISDPDYVKVLREVSGKNISEDEYDSESLTESEIRLLPTFIETLDIADVRAIAGMDIIHPDDTDYTQLTLHSGRLLFVKIDYERFRDMLNEHGGGVLVIE